MSWLTWIVVGLVAGFIGKAIMPGTKDEPGGWLGTMLLGIVGAVVGGWVWSAMFNAPGATGFNLGSILVAVVGAIICIGAMRLFDRGTKSY